MKRRMWRCLSPLLLSSALAACASHPDSPASIKVYKARGSVQCAGRGTPAAAMSHELTAAGIRVLSVACGHDGLARIALCGTPDGAINVFEIPASDRSGALSLSFLPLSGLPAATEVPCP